MLAQEEARRLGHNFVGTEQVRRPSARAPPPVVARPPTAPTRCLFFLGPRSKVIQPPALSPTEPDDILPRSPQIMLGLIGEGTGIAAKVLKSMGASLPRPLTKDISNPSLSPTLSTARKKNAHPRRRLTTPSSPFFPSPTLRHLPQGGAHRG